MSIPFAFPPVEYKDYILVDGGIVDNIPVDVVEQMEADFVISVDITSPPLMPAMYRDVIGIANQLTDILSKAQNVAYSQNADLIIKPDLRKHGFANYSKFDSLIAWGYQAAMAKMDSIKMLLSRKKKQSKSKQTSHENPNFESRIITEIQILGNRYLQKDLIKKDFNLKTKTPFNLDDALHGMDVVYASGFFKSSWLDFLPEGDTGIKVVLYVDEAERRTVEIGLAYNDDDKAKGFLRIQNRNLFGWGERAQMVLFGSDLETGVRLHLQGDRLFGTKIGYKLQTEIIREKPKFFQNHKYINRTQFERKGISLMTNFQLSRASLFQIGLNVEQVKIKERLGIDFTSTINQLRVLKASIIWDELDRVYLPTRGGNISASYEKNFQDLGANSSYWRAQGLFLGVLPINARNVLMAHLFVGLSGAVVPVHEQFRLGGPAMLPGFHRDELWGNQAVAAGITYSFLIQSNFGVVTRFSAGNVWENRKDISIQAFQLGAGLGLQYITPVGPIAADFGINDFGEVLFYFTVGYQ
jgi:NTE family protein